MFWERLYNLCTEKSCKPNTVAKAIGLSTATTTKWKNGAIPNGEALSKIADYLDCSIDYLLGRTDNPNLINNEEYSNHNIKNILNNGVNNNSTFINGLNNSNVVNGITGNNVNINKNDDYPLSEQQKALIEIYNSLNVKKQIELMSFAFKLEENKN